MANRPFTHTNNEDAAYITETIKEKKNTNKPPSAKTNTNARPLYLPRMPFTSKQSGKLLPGIAQMFVKSD